MGLFINQHRPRFHLTLQEAATRFGVSPQALAWGVRRGKLRFKRVMHRTWVTPSAVTLFLDRERGHPHAPWNTPCLAS